MKKLLPYAGLIASLFLQNNASASGPEILLTTDASPSPGCIGGARCGVDKAYTIDTGSTYFITKVIVEADDNVGDKTRAHLECYVDGVFAGELDVSKNGSSLAFKPNLSGRRVELRSVREDHNPLGDETNLYYVAVYGNNP